MNYEYDNEGGFGVQNFGATDIPPVLPFDNGVNGNLNADEEFTPAVSSNRMNGITQEQSGDGRSVGKRSSKGKEDSGVSKDDTSDGDDSLFGGEAARGALLEQVKKARGQVGGVSLSVHYPIQGEDESWYVKVLFSGGLPWYLPPEVLKGVLFSSVARSALFTQTGKNWTDTLTKHAIRVIPHGSDTYKRSSRGWTTDLNGMVLCFRESELDSLPQAIDEIVTLLINVFGEHRTRRIGGVIVPLLQEARPSVYENELNKGTEKTELAMANRMTVKLNSLFKIGKIDVQYDVNYNKFLTNYDIQQFLIQYIGINSFSILDEETLKNLFKFYPRDRLPEWSQICMESLIA